VLLFGGIIALLAVMGPKPPSVPSKAVLVLDMDRSLPYGTPEDDPRAAIQKALDGNMGQDIPLPALIEALDRAADDPKISGLFVTGNVRGSGAAALLELRQALKRFKEKKPVLAYNLTWDRNDLYLCGGLGKVLLNPLGMVGVIAPSANPMFYKRLFDKYGIEVQVTKVGKYKSAVEPFILDRMSPESREQVQGYLGEIWDGLKNGIAAGRGLEPATIQRLADTKGILNSQAALEAKLVDGLANYDEVLDALKEMAGKKPEAKDFPQMDIETYAKVPNPSEKKTSKNRIAVVVAEGTIVDGEGKAGEIGGDALAKKLRALRMDKNVKALVLCVNSPGGSTAASEIIQRELVAFKKDRPLVVSMGDVAASGGYWISTVADRIFAEPSTITGSIGVFGMWPNAKKFANDHGLTTDSVQTAELGLPSMLRPLMPKEKDMFQSLVDDIYEQFLDKVSASRSMPKPAVHEIAQGRVWSGRKALELKLVDELGGLDAAIKHAAMLAKIEGDYRLDKPDEPKSPIERFMGILGGGEKKKLVRVGHFDAAKNDLEAALMQLRSLNDPRGVYALAPVEMTIK
jgi:protease-4